MPSSRPQKSSTGIIVALIAIVAAVILAFIVKDDHLLAGLTFVAAITGAAATHAFAPRRPKAGPSVCPLTPTEVAPLLKGVQDSRNELIGAMAILQEEIRILQDAAGSSSDSRELRDELARLRFEITALKSAFTGAPAPKPTVVVEKKPVIPASEEDDGDFDVAPLSFDDEADEKHIAKALVPKARPAPKADTIFLPDADPVLDTGLGPVDMEDDGDWFSGGIEVDVLVVVKKVDFEEIVKKDAARPKPQVDEEEQRVLREEMAQMADEDDWVGGGLEDRDVKVKTTTTTANDAMLEKLRAEVEAKRAAATAAAPVRAPARGETALLVNATIPHGSKLFIRGVGPGLNVEKGAPMQQSGHGKWQWICAEQGKPCVVTVWENDDTQSEGNPIRIPGGFALTVTPTFRRKLKL